MSGLTIYAHPGDFRALKALIAAEYNGVEIAKPHVEGKAADAAAAKNPAGVLPVLETPQGTLFESNAIARYVARIRRDTELLGKTFFESGQVDAWLDFAAHELELPITMWIFPILGQMDFVPAAHETAVANTHKALAALEKHLLSRTFLVGESITLADIVIASTLFYPFKLVLDGAVQDKYTCVTRWFVTCVNQPEFRRVLGDVPLCTEAMKAAGAPAKAAGGAGKQEKKEKKEQQPKKEQPKKEEAKKEEKKPAKKEEDDGEEEEAARPPPKDPFSHLPKPTMVMDEWKRTYSNTKPCIGAMPWFWEKLDRAGYSLWLQKYKYNEENTKDFTTCNAISGFLQRCDEVRKGAFGVMYALGAEPPYVTQGVWLVRGQDIKPMLEANPDAEYYEWIKMDPENPEDRKKTEEWWCGDGEVLEGVAVLDCKVFK